MLNIILRYCLTLIIKKFTEVYKLLFILTLKRLR